MKKKFLAALISIFAIQAQAIPTLMRTYISQGPGPMDTPCWDGSCIQPEYADILEMQQYQKDQQELQQQYEKKIAALERLLKSYKEQIAKEKADIADTLIYDPQFRKAIYDKIKEERK